MQTCIGLDTVKQGLQIADYVHEYYSVARFRAAYEGRVEPFPDRSQWLEVDLGYKVFHRCWEEQQADLKCRELEVVQSAKLQRKRLNIKGVETLGTLPRHASWLSMTQMEKLEAAQRTRGKQFTATHPNYTI